MLYGQVKGEHSSLETPLLSILSQDTAGVWPVVVEKLGEEQNSAGSLGREGWHKIRVSAWHCNPPFWKSYLLVLVAELLLQELACGSPLEVSQG